MKTFEKKSNGTVSPVHRGRIPVLPSFNPAAQIQRAQIRQVLRSPRVQAKLTIGQPNDKYEQEADCVADAVMRMPEPQVERQPKEEEEEQEEIIQTKPLAEQITPLVQSQIEPEEEEEEEEPIQAKVGDDAQLQRQEEESEEEEEPIQTKQVSTHAPAVTPNLASRIQSLKGGGQPLPPTVRNYMEPRFSHDFSNVRIHTGQASSNTAKQLNARAFTTGKNIFFGEQQYSPHTTSGKSLLAHELSHVMQQNNRGGSIDNKNIIQRYSASSAVSYALKYALAPNTKSYMYYSSDCTNFISQALYAGGWTMKTGRGYCKDLRNNDVWWYRKNGCIEGKICTPWGFNCVFKSKRHNSHTWSVADHFYYFAKKSWRATAIKYFRQLRVGDVLQRSKPFSTDINHTMIVTKKAGKNFYLSYHTNNRKNKPFYTEGSTKGFYAICPPPHYNYYGWNIT